MSDYIPDHLFAKVLLRLPFESLLQSRCVSKSWRALIDSSGFIKMHLNKSHQATTSHNEMKIIALNDQNKFYTLDLDLEADQIKITASAKQLNYPLDYCKSEVRLIGSCNGLLCLMYPNTESLVLWNPWIQKSWELPSPQVEYSMCGGAAFLLGFGYDHVNDDYKVLNRMRFSDLFVEDQSSWYDEVYVYSLKMNSWRRIEHFPFNLRAGYHYYFPQDCILANGALHWMMKENEWNGVAYIISFDLSSEEFRKMPCPSYPEDAFQQNLRVLNGSLCFLAYYYAMGVHAVDLLVMEDYGVDKSWTKLTSVEMPDMWTFWRLKPLVYSKNKRQLILQIDGEKLVIYDLETKTISDVAISSGEVGSFVDSCTSTGSLIRPSGTG